MSIRLSVNGTEHTLDVDPDMPLLWAVRDVLVFHEPTQRTLRFAELADEAGRAPTPKSAEIKLRPLSELKRLRSRSTKPGSWPTRARS